MRKMIWTLTASALLHGAAMAQSAPTTQLSLSTALERAYKNNPTLAAARNEVFALDGAVQQADTSPNPELATLLEDTRSATRTTTVQLNQPIELGGKRTARTNAAQGSKQTAVADLQIVKAELQTAVAAAFYDTLIAQERLQLAKSSVALADSAAQAAQKRVEAGKISPVEATKASIAASGALVDLARAETELRTARKRLAATMGNTTVDFELVSGDLELPPNLPDSADLKTRLDQSPRYIRAQQEVTRRDANSALEYSKRVPDLTVSLGNKNNKELGLNQTVFGLAIPIPVFDQNQGNILDALRRADKAKDELSATRIQLSQDLEIAYDNLNASRQEFLTLRDSILPSAETAYKAATQGFEMGKFSFLEVLDAQRTLFETTAQSLKALANAQRYNAELQGILGLDVISNQPLSPVTVK